MAQYSHLPIYIKTYNFIKVISLITRQFKKEYKYTLGAELQQIVWQILDEIIIANSLPDKDKKKAMENISTLFDRFKIRLRFAFEIGLMTGSKFGLIQKDIEEIGKMIGGWQKYLSKF